MNDYRSAWSRAVGYYSTHRNCKDEIYKSEEYFLSKILKPGMSILDVGCAVGGFYNILRGIQPDISYTGIDISDEMIKEARRLHPGIRFEKMMGDNIRYETGFDLVFCSGVLHLDLNWRKIINECWRLATRYFLFDIRLVEGNTIENINESYQKIDFDGKWDGESAVPYILLNVSDFLKVYRGLKPMPARMMAFGYFHPVANTVVTRNRVCMTMVCLGKTKEREDKPIQWDVPIALPETMLN